ncbi:MFS transporter [Photobacterium rosenbergii]|uniref:MFS transporter n=1 Tax=Photobacterium rosenbergii TaxID=294936 RepID=UPI001C9A1BB8|nr:MFS transporter [Photobacterium rosenbergii]MBY5945953.1 MFS transporter [Photobacterium rosenbergii]
MHKYHFQLMNLGHALNHFFILIFPTAILGIQQDWGMSYDELLRLGSLGMLAYGLGSLPSGWLGDRWSKRAMMLLFFFGMGIAAIFTALAQTPFQLSIGVIAIGLFASIYHPVGIALVFATTEKTGRAIAINGLAGNIGLACAAAVTAYLTQTINWQSAFFIPGILCVLIGMVYGRVSKDVSYKQQNKTQQTPVSQNQLLRLLLAIAIIATFGGLVFQTITAALPKILQDTFTLPLSQIGLLATGIFTLAAFAQLIIGELIDRISAKRLLFCVVGGQTSFLLLASFTSGWMLVLCLTGLVFSTYAQIPINDWLIGKSTSDKWRSTVYAVKYMLSFTTGPIAYWLIAYSYSTPSETASHFSSLYWLLAGVMCLSMAAVVFMPGEKTSSVKQSTRSVVPNR